MGDRIPSEEQVLGYFDSLSNWGRWGKDDQLGTLNLITPEKTKRAVGLVQEGVTVTCARTISYENAPDVWFQPQHFMIESGEGWASGDKVSARPCRLPWTTSVWCFTASLSPTSIAWPTFSGKARCTMAGPLIWFPPARELQSSP